MEIISTTAQQYDPDTLINKIRGYVDQWRALPNPDQWQVTPETARLLQHWRSTSDTVLKSNAASAIVA